MFGRFSQPAVGDFAAREVEPGAQAIAIVGDTVVEQRWGLLAPWRGHGGVRPPPIRTALLGDVSRTPVLRKAMRCLVPSEGVLVRTKHGGKLRSWMLAAGDGPMLLAALSVTSKDDGVAAMCLLVAPAPPDLASYCDVVPVVADATWTTGGEPLARSWRALDPAANRAQGSLF